jgi:hypothetical protein
MRAVPVQPSGAAMVTASASAVLVSCPLSSPLSVVQLRLRSCADAAVHRQMPYGRCHRGIGRAWLHASCGGFSRLDDHSATVDVAEMDLHSSDPHRRRPVGLVMIAMGAGRSGGRFA